MLTYANFVVRHIVAYPFLIIGLALTMLSEVFLYIGCWCLDLKLEDLRED